jgi:hypothetical protein
MNTNPAKQQKANSRSYTLGGTMNTITSSLISLTIEIWQDRSREKLTGEDVRQMVSNVHGFFSTLSDWAMHTEAGSGSYFCGSLQPCSK